MMKASNKCVWTKTYSPFIADLVFCVHWMTHFPGITSSNLQFQQSKLKLSQFTLYNNIPGVSYNIINSSDISETEGYFTCS